MASVRAYLDYNATAPLLDVAREAIVDALGVTGNPSSVHQEGRAARRLVETARERVAALVGGKAENVVFTSGATEAASTLLTPRWRLGRGPLVMSRLYVCAADHPCTLLGGRFAPHQIERVGVDRDGLMRLDELEALLASHDRSQGVPLVAVHHANNETGVIQPVARIAAMVRAAGGVLVVDAVQAAGRIPLDMSDGYGDFLFLSAHKIGGPKGVGAFVGAEGLMVPTPLIAGGGQQRGHRGGTENVAGIAGFGAAAQHSIDAVARTGRLRAIRDLAEAAIRQAAPDAVIYAEATERLPNTVFFAVPGIKAETAQIALDLAGIAVSSGSACSSGKVGSSHVLKAMGVASAEGGIRVSVGEATTEAEVDRFADALTALTARRRQDVASAA